MSTQMVHDVPPASTAPICYHWKQIGNSVGVGIMWVWVWVEVLNTHTHTHMSGCIQGYIPGMVI